MFGNLNIPLSVMDRTTTKTSKEVEDLNNTISTNGAKEASKEYSAQQQQHIHSSQVHMKCAPE